MSTIHDTTDETWVDHPADLPLPVGADPENIDNFETGSRLIWSHPQPLPDELAREDVRVVVVQYHDGCIATDGDDQPLVYVGGSDYTVANARALAQAIIQAADQADRWAGAATKGVASTDTLDDSWADPAWQVDSRYCPGCHAIGCLACTCVATSTTEVTR